MAKNDANKKAEVATSPPAAKATTKPQPTIRCKALINFQLGGRPAGTTNKDDKGTPNIDAMQGDILNLPEAVFLSRQDAGWVEIHEEVKA